jgi:hypothetical protein
MRDSESSLAGAETFVRRSGSRMTIPSPGSRWTHRAEQAEQVSQFSEITMSSLLPQTGHAIRGPPPASLIRPANDIGVEAPKANRHRSVPHSSWITNRPRAWGLLRPIRVRPSAPDPLAVRVPRMLERQKTAGPYDQTTNLPWADNPDLTTG